MWYLFGRIPWINVEQHKFFNIFSRIYPGIIAFAVFLCYTFSSKYFQNYFNLGRFLACSDVIMFIVLGNYVPRKYWKQWFELSTNLTTESNLNNRRSLGLKLMTILVINTTYFLSVRITKYHYYEEQNYAVDIMMFMAIQSNLLPAVLLMILLEEFKQINVYWKNIYKWHRIGLRMRSGRDATFCKNRYELLYKLHVCFQKINGLLVAIFCVEEIINLIVFTNYVIRKDIMKSYSLSSLIAVWGNNIQIIVSKMIFSILYFFSILTPYLTEGMLQIKKCSVWTSL